MFSDLEPYIAVKKSSLQLKSSESSESNKKSQVVTVNISMFIFSILEKNSLFSSVFIGKISMFDAIFFMGNWPLSWEMRAVALHKSLVN